MGVIPVVPSFGFGGRWGEFKELKIAGTFGTITMIKLRTRRREWNQYMENIPVMPMIGSFFSRIPNDAKRMSIDRKRYYLSDAKILQESCEVYSVGLTTGILFTFRDYGVCDIKQIGFTLVIETKHHVYALEKTYASITYKNDNQFVIHIIDLQRLPIERCSLIVNWILYNPTICSYAAPDRKKIGKSFERLKKKDSEHIRKIDTVRKDCPANPDSSSSRKSKLPDSQMPTAWTVYTELEKPFSEIRDLIEDVKASGDNLFCADGSANTTSNLISVPINCYFDKGFYSTVYYAKNYPIIEKRLSDGKSALQCIVAVPDTQVDLLFYLYYCTISQRGYFQYMTEEQKHLQTYLQENHPVMLLQKKLENVNAAFLGSEIVNKSDVFLEVQHVVEECFKKFHSIRENAYNAMVANKQTHGKWVNEFKLFMLLKAIFPDAEYQYTAEWLGHQTLDVFIPSLKCAIEYQGEQHYQVVEYFGGEEKLAEQEMMDEVKRQKCTDNGIMLLEWPYDLRIQMPNVCCFLKGSVADEYLEETRIKAQVTHFPISNWDDLLSYTRQIKIAIPEESSCATVRENRYEIRKYDTAGKYIRSYERIAEAAETEGLSVGGISKVIYRERRTAGGFQWRRCEKQEPKENIAAIET